MNYRKTTGHRKWQGCVIHCIRDWDLVTGSACMSAIFELASDAWSTLCNFCFEFFFVLPTHCHEMIQGKVNLTLKVHKAFEWSSVKPFRLTRPVTYRKGTGTVKGFRLGLWSCFGFFRSFTDLMALRAEIKAVTADVARLCAPWQRRAVTGLVNWLSRPVTDAVIPQRCASHPGPPRRAAVGKGAFRALYQVAEQMVVCHLAFGFDIWLSP